MPLTAQVHENGKFLRKKSNGWERQGTFISSGDDTKQKKPNILFSSWHYSRFGFFTVISGTTLVKFSFFAFIWAVYFICAVAKILRVQKFV